ncbi:MAG: hypothetical protein MHM6MM_002888 [Cercozoa sp. M6MM]
MPPKSKRGFGRRTKRDRKQSTMFQHGVRHTPITVDRGNFDSHSSTTIRGRQNAIDIESESSEINLALPRSSLAELAAADKNDGDSTDDDVVDLTTERIHESPELEPSAKRRKVSIPVLPGHRPQPCISSDEEDAASDYDLSLNRSSAPAPIDRRGHVQLRPEQSRPEVDSLLGPRVIDQSRSSFGLLTITEDTCSGSSSHTDVGDEDIVVQIPENEPEGLAMIDDDINDDVCDLPHVSLDSIDDADPVLAKAKADLRQGVYSEKGFARVMRLLLPLVSARIDSTGSICNSDSECINNNGNHDNNNNNNSNNNNNDNNNNNNSNNPCEPVDLGNSVSIHDVSAGCNNRAQHDYALDCDTGLGSLSDSSI